jgi:acetylornithine/succinyldiaminopimelate/putrescine aminotransferase
MSPPVSDFIATEARFGAHNYEPLGVILSRGEGVWVWDTLSRLPLRLFGREPGPLPSEDLGRYGGAGG